MNAFYLTILPNKFSCHINVRVMLFPNSKDNVESIESTKKSKIHIDIEHYTHDDATQNLSLPTLFKKIIKRSNTKLINGKASLDFEFIAERLCIHSTDSNSVSDNVMLFDSNSKKATHIKNTRVINIHCKVKKEDFTIDPKDILYAKSDGNYTVIFFVMHDKKILRMIKRMTLSDFEKQLASANNVLRIHKSFLVNLIEVNKVTGNSAGLQISLKQIKGLKIPVSRNNVLKFKARLASYK